MGGWVRAHSLCGCTCTASDPFEGLGVPGEWLTYRFCRFYIFKLLGNRKKKNCKSQVANAFSHQI